MGFQDMSFPESKRLPADHIIFQFQREKKKTNQNRWKSNLQQNYNPVVCFFGKAVLFISDTSGALLWSGAPTECLQHLHWGVHSWIHLAQLGTPTIHIEFHKYDLANFQTIGWTFLHEELPLSPTGQQDFTLKKCLWFNRILWYLGHLPEKLRLVLLTTEIPSHHVTTLADLIIFPELISISKEVLFFPDFYSSFWLLARIQ